MKNRLLVGVVVVVLVALGWWLFRKGPAPEPSAEAPQPSAEKPRTGDDGLAEMPELAANQPVPPNVGVRGRVLYPDGGPVDGAEVVTNKRQRTFTSDGGQYAVLAPPEEVTLTASVPGWASRATRTVKAPASGIDLVLPAGATLVGDVSGTDDFTGLVVMIDTEARGPERRMARVRLDAVGRFTVEGLPPGPVNVAVRLMGGSSLAEAQVTMPSSGSEYVKLEVPPLVGVWGRVQRPGGTPVPEVRVFFRSKGDGGTFISTATSGDDGTFDAGRLVAGAYEVSDGLAHGRMQVPDVSKVPVVVVVPDRFRLIGRVVDQKAQPIPVFAVGAAPFSSADGRFSLELEPTHQVTFRAQGFPTRTVQVRDAGSTVDLGDVVLRNDRTLEVTVVTQGVPVPNAEVKVSSFGDRQYPKTVRTDGQGVAKAEAVAPEPLDVEVSAPGFGTVNKHVGPEVKALTVTLEAGASLEVTVKGAEGQRGSVFVQRASGGFGDRSSESARLPEEGPPVVKFEGIAAGEWTVRVVLPRSPVDQFPKVVTLVAGQLTRLVVSPPADSVEVALEVLDAKGQPFVGRGQLFEGKHAAPASRDESLQLMMQGLHVGRREGAVKLPPGAYSYVGCGYSAEAKSEVCSAASFTVGAGAKQSVRVVLPEGVPLAPSKNEPPAVREPGRRRRGD